ncbi:MAG: hypothetical protein GEU86_12895 [Actinophytocola sp.]|nr:hypothetical protein [Actinophytocola sp.]
MNTHTKARDAEHVPLSRAQRLAQDAEEAARVRAFAEHPDVIALRVEKVRTQIDVLMWTGILLGLAFTMVNVQSFAAEGAGLWSLPWIAAWLLDPMVSLVLIAVLRAEQVTARWQVETGRWIRRTKWFAFAATYLMNTWQSWAVLHPAGIVLHSVPPLLVYLASEAAPVLRDRLTESVRRAAGEHHHPHTMNPATNTGVNDTVNAAVNVSAGVHEPSTVGVHDGDGERPAAGVHEPVPAPVRTPRRTPAKAAAKAGGGRKSRADYLADARAMWTPTTEVTPAWIRQATGCSRGLSSALAAELRTEIDNHPSTETATAMEQERAA